MMAAQDEDKKNDGDVSYYDAVMSSMTTEVNDMSFENFYGAEQSVEMLKESIVFPLLFPHLFEGSRWPCWTALMLYGVPGCGKTYLLKACAQGCQVKLFVFHVWNLQSRSIGGEERAQKCIETVFKVIQNNTPCILCFDDMEVFSREESHFKKGRLTLFQKLHEKDGRPEERKNMVIGLTHSPWKVEPCLRKRFMRKPGSHVHLPALSARTQLLKSLVEHNNTSHDLQMKDFEDIAEKTEGFSGADIHCLVRSASMAGIRELMKATHFKSMETQGTEQDSSIDVQDENQSLAATSHQEKKAEDVKPQGKFTPCKPEDDGAIAMTVFEIPEDRLCVEHDITCWSLRKALSDTLSSITNEELAKMQRFEEDFG